MHAAGRLFDLGPGVYCQECFCLPVCGAEATEFACPPRWGRADEGGQHVLHPARGDSGVYFELIGGAGYGSEIAKPVQLVSLPPYLPQVRVRRGLRGSLGESVYAVRAHAVIGDRPHPLTASGLREHLGLAEKQALVLLLFDKDDILERLWNDTGLVRELAAAGYDLIVSPSYSCWWPRPRQEHLYNLKRSLRMFSALQALGAPAIPRFGWFIEMDVVRAASWLLENECARMIGVDLQSYKSDSDWRGQIQGLAQLDRLTGRRLRYLVNGPTTATRCGDVYAAVPPRRVSITNATLGPPPEDPAQLELELERGKQIARNHAARCKEMRRMLQLAARTARGTRLELAGLGPTPPVLRAMHGRQPQAAYRG